MKALTIYQPWASLIMAGAKPFEFRGWSPRERGGKIAALIGQRIVIHASARAINGIEIGALYADLRAGSERAAGTCLVTDKALALLHTAIVRHETGHGYSNLPLGVGLGTAVLGEPRDGLEIAEEFGVPRANDSNREEHANFGWPMLDIEVWPQPVPMRGAQGFWNWPTPEGAGL